MQLERLIKTLVPALEILPGAQLLNVAIVLTQLSILVMPVLLVMLPLTQRLLALSLLDSVSVSLKT